MPIPVRERPARIPLALSGLVAALLLGGCGQPRHGSVRLPTDGDMRGKIIRGVGLFGYWAYAHGCVYLAGQPSPNPGGFGLGLVFPPGWTFDPGKGEVIDDQGSSKGMLGQPVDGGGFSYGKNIPANLTKCGFADAANLTEATPERPTSLPSR